MTYVIEMWNRVAQRWDRYPGDRRPVVERWALELELKTLRDTARGVEFRIAPAGLRPPGPGADREGK